MTAPIFSHRGIPSLAKIGFAGLLSLLLLPAIPADQYPAFTNLPDDAPPFILMIAQELLIGVLIGFVSNLVNLVFVAVDMAARMMSLQIGFQAANLFDPLSNAPTSALEQFYTLLALTLFLTIDGHHGLMIALARTFEIAPLGNFILTGLTVQRLLLFTNETFITAMRLALPIVGVLLLTDLGLGLIARAVPQVQVFFLGLPLKMGLGLLILAFTLSVTLSLFKGSSADAVILLAGFWLLNVTGSGSVASLETLMQRSFTTMATAPFTGSDLTFNTLRAEGITAQAVWPYRRLPP